MRSGKFSYDVERELFFFGCRDPNSINREVVENLKVFKHLEIRSGPARLEHVFHSHLKCRCQHSNETLQEFGVYIAGLV